MKNLFFQWKGEGNRFSIAVEIIEKSEAKEQIEKEGRQGHRRYHIPSITLWAK